MLTSVTNLGRSGLQDWLIQRISAVVLAVYMLTIMVAWFIHPQMDSLAWQALFANVLMKYATLLALLALIAHAWIGIWTISTDYVHKIWLRLPLQILVYIMMLFYLVWGLQILWA